MLSRRIPICLHEDVAVVLLIGPNIVVNIVVIIVVDIVVDIHDGNRTIVVDIPDRAPAVDVDFGSGIFNIRVDFRGGKRTIRVDVRAGKPGIGMNNPNKPSGKPSIGVDIRSGKPSIVVDSRKPSIGIDIRAGKPPVGVDVRAKRPGRAHTPQLLLGEKNLVSDILRFDRLCLFFLLLQYFPTYLLEWTPLVLALASLSRLAL